MKLVAKVNGVKVYSDKAVQVITNGTIIFADGSICIPATRKIINEGEGLITFDAKEAQAYTKAHTKEDKKIFPGSRVRIFDLAANVRVMPHPENAIEVIIRGPESAVRAVQTFQEGDLVTITGGQPGQSSGAEVQGVTTIIENALGSVFSGNFRGAINIGSQRARRSIVMASRGGVVCAGDIDGNVIINGNNNVVQGGGCGMVISQDGPAGGEVSIEVRVPIGTYVQMSGVSGEAIIGDTLGDVRLHAEENNKIMCGKVRNARATAKKYGTIEIAGVTGDARLLADGYSNVTVRGGKIGQLEANAEEYSRISVNAEAQSAELSAEEYSHIVVSRVVERPSRSTNEYSTIKVGNW